MIHAEHLTKAFDGFVALDNLDTTIAEGSIYGLVGSNGSGKSTLLRLISGVYYPNGGWVRIDDQDVYENPELKNRIFFLSDDLYFLSKATVDEMADFYSRVYTNFSWEKYAEYKRLFPIDTKKRINTFSKGMKRQAAIMLALSCCPDYLLLDEAFDGLDPVIRLLVKKLIMGEIADRRMTVVVTSHNLRELEDLCDHVGLLHKGRILFERELDDLKLGLCKVQAVLPQDVDWDQAGLNVMQCKRQGSVVNLLVRGPAEESLEIVRGAGASFAEAVPLTLEEVFIGEMEGVGYDYDNLIF
ncbi:MAG: ABC transporter ATP-binding protein [Oscillospiraceae bacterium]|nr:ABC transporter ATP-binding protein [Oscillospiraceae bacterium]MBQ8918168.1 ABC transporter ATP-binding protein [Oscillospiraceae bacterium]